MHNTIYIMFRNDDPGPLSNPRKERKVLELFERYSIPQVLAVIPNNVEDPHIVSRGAYHLLEENPRMIEILKEYAAKGLVEISQHGYTHQTSRFRPGKTERVTPNHFYPGIDRRWAPYDPAHPDGYSEFNGLPEEEQHEKVVKGQEYLEKIFGFKLKSFIFPWNAYNSSVLKLLRDRGFKYVPCEDDTEVVPGLCLIGACNWDWEIKRFYSRLKEAEALNKPVLMQFAYHSWEVSDEMLKQFEDLFKRLSAKSNVKFVLPSDIPTAAPWAEKIIALRCRVLCLQKKLNVFLRDELEAPKYYVNDPQFYKKQIIKLTAALWLLKYVGLKRLGATAVIGLAVVIPVIVMRAHLEILNWLDAAILLILLGALGLYRKVSRRVKGGSSQKREKDTNPAAHQESYEAKRNEIDNDEDDDGIPRSEIAWGDFKRTAPIGGEMGADRGTPIDRYYIEQFIQEYSADIKGHVLELEDDAYTVRFGGNKVVKSDVLNLDPGNAKATIVGDLVKGDVLPPGVFDCVILTQALFLIYDLKSAVKTLYRILKPGGVLLVTVAGISQIADSEGASWSDHWRFTTSSLKNVLLEAFPEGSISVRSYGNVKAAVSFLHGLALEELDKKDLDHYDRMYQFVVAARAVKR